MFHKNILICHQKLTINQASFQKFCANTGCNPEDLQEAMDDRGGSERGSGYGWCDIMMMMTMIILLAMGKLL